MGLIGLGACYGMAGLLGSLPVIQAPLGQATGDLATNNVAISHGAYTRHNESTWCPDWDPRMVRT